jgi:hypothetical protein
MKTKNELAAELKTDEGNIRKILKSLQIKMEYTKIKGRRVSVLTDEQCDAVRTALAEKYKNPLTYRDKNESYQEKLAKEKESKGFSVIRAFNAGFPDLVILSPKLLELLKKEPQLLTFTEAKGLGDSLSKEQFEFNAKMKELGIPADISWEQTEL